MIHGIRHSRDDCACCITNQKELSLSRQLHPLDYNASPVALAMGAVHL